ILEKHLQQLQCCQNRDVVPDAVPILPIGNDAFKTFRLRHTSKSLGLDSSFGFRDFLGGGSKMSATDSISSYNRRCQLHMRCRSNRVKDSWRMAGVIVISFLFRSATSQS